MSKPKPPCTHKDGCTEPQSAKGLCARHYQQHLYQQNKQKYKDRARRWREANTERKRQIDKQWRADNTERKRETDRKWREANPERKRENDQRYYDTHREERYEENRNRYAALKLETLWTYGEGFCAKHVEFFGHEFRPENIFDLEIVFLDGKGGEHRRELTGSPTGRSTLVWIKLKEQGYPEDLSIATVCAACRARLVRTWARGIDNGPSSYRKLKTRALLAYGDGSCAICGVRPDDILDLELDHVNGDGSEHRRKLGNKYGYSFLSLLRGENWPNDPPLQTLCAPCHKAKSAVDRANKALARRTRGVIRE